MRVIGFVLLALVAETHAEDSDKLVDRALKAETQRQGNLAADLEDTTLGKAQPTTHSAEEANGLPTPNATLNKMLEEKWAPKIKAGPHTCNDDDKRKIMAFPSGHADDSWGKKISDCGHAGLNIFTGVNADEFNTCLAKDVKLTPKCSNCYAKMAEYDFQNCKVQCLFNWCSEGCITCNHGSDVIGCIGFVDPQPTICTTASAELFQRYPNMISCFGVVLIGLFMGSGVMFSVAQKRRTASIPHEEPLMVNYR